MESHAVEARRDRQFRRPAIRLDDRGISSVSRERGNRFDGVAARSSILPAARRSNDPIAR